MTVRTAVLARDYLVGGSDVDMQTVPANETWIIKSAEIGNAGLGNTNVQLYALEPIVGTRATFFQQTLGTAGIAHYQGWVVLEPGDVIHAYTSTQDAYVWISGAKLVGVAPP